MGMWRPPLPPFLRDSITRMDDLLPPEVLHRRVQNRNSYAFTAMAIVATVVVILLLIAYFVRF